MRGSKKVYTIVSILHLCIYKNHLEVEAYKPQSIVEFNINNISNKVINIISSFT